MVSNLESQIWKKVGNKKMEGDLWSKTPAEFGKISQNLVWSNAYKRSFYRIRVSQKRN